jgi:hypothetical protein
VRGLRDYNLEADNAAIQSWRTAIPDLKVTVERAVAEHDRVAVHWRALINTVAGRRAECPATARASAWKE